MADSSYEKFEIRRRNPDPSSAALLVIDMQNYFSSMAKPILPALRNTIHLCRSNGIPIIFTRHSHKSSDDYGMIGEWWNDDVIIDGSVASELMPEIGCTTGDKIVQKHTYSAFFETDMESILKEKGIKEVIITGVMTNLCCETTAREAFVKGFRVFFSTDSTATSSRKLHVSTLKNMAYGFAYLVDCHRLRQAFPVEV